VAVLGTTQTVSWASSYYLIAILADDVAAATAVSRTWVFAAFSASLLLSAALGPIVGRWVDRYGGSRILIVSHLVLAGGLFALSLCVDAASLALAWALVGVGRALGLYDAAFATLAGIYGREARASITGITLIAGFASTIGWPLSALLDASIGWRGTCIAWGAAHLLVGLPLSLLLPRKLRQASESQGANQPKAAAWEPRKEMILLAYVFAASWFVTGAMAAHLPTLLERTGASSLEAVAAAALVGPAQVAARAAEFLIMRQLHPLVSARIAAAMHPIGAVALVAIGSPAALLFTLFLGAGNGLFTIARGTVPLALFGPQGYGTRTGLIGAPARTVQALAPFLFGLLLDLMGRGVLLVSAGLCLSALAALFALRATSPPVVAGVAPAKAPAER
jgi:MFS family permease